MEKPLEQNLASRLPPEGQVPSGWSPHPGGRHTRLECYCCSSSVRAWPTVPLSGLKLPVHVCLWLMCVHVALSTWGSWMCQGVGSIGLPWPRVSQPQYLALQARSFFAWGLRAVQGTAGIFRQELVALPLSTVTTRNVCRTCHTSDEGQSAIAVYLLVHVCFSALSWFGSPPKRSLTQRSGLGEGIWFIWEIK